MSMTRVMIAASSMALRVGLRALLQEAAEAGDLKVSAEAASLEAPIPDVDVILAAGELKMNVPAAETERLPGLLVMAHDAEAAQSVLQNWPGVLWGAVDENSGGAELAAALCALAEGLLVGSPALLESLVKNQDRSPAETEPADGEGLTAREREVLAHLALGLANKQISAALGISEHTVKFHVSSIYMKLGVSSRMEAVRAGVKLGLVAL